MTSTHLVFYHVILYSWHNRFHGRPLRGIKSLVSATNPNARQAADRMTSTTPTVPARRRPWLALFAYVICDMRAKLLNCFLRRSCPRVHSNSGGQTPCNRWSVSRRQNLQIQACARARVFIVTDTGHYNNIM